MNATDQLDSTATETLIRFLSSRFDLKVPKIKITNRRANHGTYFPNLIRLSADAKVWVVVHEFAHHLDSVINGAFYRNRLYGQGSLGGIRFRRPHTQALHHGEGFYFGLKRVIEAAGCQDYPWQSEYKCLKYRAERDGLVRPATPTQETPLEKCAQCGKLTEETWSASDGVNESIRVCADCRGER